MTRTETWRAVAQQIDDTWRGIWAEEPVAVRRLRLGVVPTGAGSFSQYFSTLVFALTYTLTLGEHVVYGLVKAADDPNVTLGSLKAMVRDHFVTGFEAPRFLGYVLDPTVHTLAEKIVQVLDDVQDKAAFKELLGGYLTYLNILHWWLHIVFPWNVGSLFPQITRERFEELRRLMPGPAD